MIKLAVLIYNSFFLIENLLNRKIKIGLLNEVNEERISKKIMDNYSFIRKELTNKNVEEDGFNRSNSDGEQNQSEIIKKISRLYTGLSEKIFTRKRNLYFEVSPITNDKTVLVKAPFMHGPFDLQLKRNQTYDPIHAFKQFLEINFNLVIDDIAVHSLHLASQYTEIGHYSFKLTVDQQNDILAMTSLSKQAIDDFSRAWQVRNLLCQEINTWCKQYRNNKNQEAKLLDFTKFVEGAFEYSLEVVEENNNSSRTEFSLAGKRWKVHAGHVNSDFSSETQLIARLNDYLCKKFVVSKSKIQLIYSQVVRPKSCLMTLDFYVHTDAFDNVLNKRASDTSEMQNDERRDEQNVQCSL